MNSGTGARRHSSQVDDEVANLAEEVVLVGVPVVASVVVGIRIDGPRNPVDGCRSLMEIRPRWLHIHTDPYTAI